MMDIEKLRKEQSKYAQKVSLKDTFKKISSIAGAVQVFYGNKIVSGMSTCDSDGFSIREQHYSLGKVSLPYMSGLLFYREGPAILEAFSLLQQKPDILLVQGNGILHPRRCGIASQIGIMLDIPTIGIAKSLALGEVNNGTIYIEKEARGYEVMSRDHARPLYVSPGHHISLQTSIEIIRKSLVYPHKLPEPLHLAARYAKKVKDALQLRQG